MHFTKVYESIEAKYWVSWLHFDVYQARIRTIKTALNSSFCAVTADSKSRWPHGKNAQFYSWPCGAFGRVIDCTQFISFLLEIERLERARCATAGETGVSKADGPDHSSRFSGVSLVGSVIWIITYRFQGLDYERYKSCIYDFLGKTSVAVGMVTTYKLISLIGKQCMGVAHKLNKHSQAKQVDFTSSISFPSIPLAAKSENVMSE